MIGLIVTGHGHFATGLLSASEVIAGEQEKALALDFPAGDSSEGLHERITAAVQSLACDSVLILADLAGGTPFNQSVLIASKASCRCRVLSGTNLPALLEAIFGRAADDDVDALARQLVDSEQTRLQLYVEQRRAQAGGKSGGI